MRSPQVIRTKIIPPQKPKRVLDRPRITAALSETFLHRFTLLQAGAGYGKSTALTSLVNGEHPIIWYQVTREDVDPLVFLLHINHATRIGLPELGGLPIPILEAWDGSTGPLPTYEVVSKYLNALCEGLTAPTLFILDDIHLAIESEEISKTIDLLLRLAPDNLHFLFASRPALDLPNLSRWQSQGMVLSLDRSDLAFTCDEIFDLFSNCYKYELSQEEAETLHAATEGWAISLQLIWQSIRTGAAMSIKDALDRQTTSLQSLFSVLAQDVYGHQAVDVQEFLRISSILRVMTAEGCDHLRHSEDSGAMLQYLHRQDLFVIDLDDNNFRYQNIFRNFLNQLIPGDQRKLWHKRAADYYMNKSDPESTIYHLLKSEDYSQASEFLEEYGQVLLNQGRLNTLEQYLETLPPEMLHKHPRLLTFLGDLARLHSRYQAALDWYKEAESIWRERGQRADIGRALRGQARIYLDTVDPSHAEKLLQQALRLSDGIDDRVAQARLYELLAENKLNAGNLDQAERLRFEADQLRLEGPADTQLMFRVLLRTGKLDLAREKLEERLEEEKKHPVSVPRAHRETLFLLSLIYSFQGQADAAFRSAEEGTNRGIELNSPFMTAVGYMRQGHALMLFPGNDNYLQARKQFQHAIEISHSLDIPRLRVEANWGLCRAFGYTGDIKNAKQAAISALEIAKEVGDEWIASLVRLAYGASLSLAGRYEASVEWLQKSSLGFLESSDPFGNTVSKLWLCVGWMRQKDVQLLSQVLPEMLKTCSQRGYDYLFTHSTLLGAPDERIFVPLLIYARDHGWETEYVNHLLGSIGLPGISLHPGYRLRVRTLGSFQVWRGNIPIETKGWRREKTRQLFQVLLTYRKAPLDREQIFEHLWPGAHPETANRNFKVALNTLYNVLEPDREPGTESAYILRQGSIYGLRPGADYVFDVDEFLFNVQKAENLGAGQDALVLSYLETAVSLYRGTYLPTARYENWAAVEREQLSVKFLHAADRLCALYITENRFGDAIELSQHILAQDNCWERAYRHMMVSYHHLGDHGQMARTYMRCIQTLQDELDVSPSRETEQLYLQLKGNL